MSTERQSNSSALQPPYWYRDRHSQELEAQLHANDRAHRADAQNAAVKMSYEKEQLFSERKVLQKQLTENEKVLLKSSKSSKCHSISKSARRN